MEESSKCTSFSFRIIVKPVVSHLQEKYASPQDKLTEILLKLKERFSSQPGYGAGNVLNLLIHLNIDLKGYDFSDLAVWEANLQKGGNYRGIVPTP